MPVHLSPDDTDENLSAKMAFAGKTELQKTRKVLNCHGWLYLWGKRNFWGLQDIKFFFTCHSAYAYAIKPDLVIYI